MSFIASLEKTPYILDVGCGNQMVIAVKYICHNCHYTGIDVADYNQSNQALSLIDKYILVKPDEFSSEISRLSYKYDAVISSHNLEHCYDRYGTLVAMLGVVKKGGNIYISFPSEKSISFPSRDGTLNYYDDSTHLDVPPLFDDVISLIKSQNFIINYSVRNYQPMVLRLLGFIIEPLSRVQKKVYPGTWEYYGFESIIHATKI